MTTAGAEGGIRYLSAADVALCLPPVPRLLELASVALRSLAAGADVPPKAALADASGGFAHAMPGRLVAASVPGGGARADLLGMKWIAGSPGNRAQGLPAMSSLIVLSDPITGLPVAVMDGGLITAWRTAALSGVAIGLLDPARDGRPVHAVVLGAGAQGRAHAAVLGVACPGVELMIHDRHPDRAAAVAAEAAAFAGVASAVAMPDPAAALRAADVVISATSLGGVPDLGPADIAPEAIVIPVDYGAKVTGDLVRAAGTVLVDDRAAYDRNRAAGRLPGWPDPTGTLGQWLIGDGQRGAGMAVALHQGPAIADLVVAAAVLEAAMASGIGVELHR